MNNETADRQNSPRAAPDVDVMVAEVETGARHCAGVTGKIILALAFVWSCFQLYIASSTPFFLTELTGINLVFNNQEARQIHLAFALVLAMLAYPLLKSSPRDRVPFYDWVLAFAGASACLYLLYFKEDIAGRAGLPTTADLVFSSLGMVTLAIAVFRALGLPLVIVASVFVFYVFFGHLSFMPDALMWKGASYSKALWHYWMQTEGVFGVALGVSASMIFLFVLFGSLLEKAGAGSYFIKLAFALLGHLRGGPAKAAVVASALSGLYSGSSIANVVTTGTFTIPLMKRTGFTAEKAGAVEVASSTNGQLTPPVMGAAAFLISEFTGVSYPELIKHAFLPAVISYIALVYIVHLEALKLGLKGLDRPSPMGTLASRLANVLFGFLFVAVIAIVVYYGLGWIKVVLPGMGFWGATLLFLAGYLALLSAAARHPDLEPDDPNTPIDVLPRPWDVAITGFHFILPIVILIWCILIERLSPTLSAYWATMAMIFIVLTQRPLKQFMRGQGAFAAGFRQGWGDFVEGMIAGARNMIGIGVATGAAGVIVGTVSLTGLHQVVGEFVEFLSGGSLMAMLLLVAVMSLLLGMGLPTTANYIVVSSLMAPVIVSVGEGSGLLLPLVAVHLFVFYFGILADDTPPVGLAAFAAAAISGGDPIRTGIQGFAYDIRTALLPFLFVFNTELLLIDVTPLKAVFIFCVAVVAMLLFAAATQGYFLARSRIWESLALLLVAFTLFRPGFWLDYLEPPFVDHPGAQILQMARDAPADGDIRFVIEGPDFNTGKTDTLTVRVGLGAPGDGAERLKRAGLVVSEADGKALLEEPFPGTPFFQKLSGYDFYGDTPVEVAKIETEAERMPKEIFYIPALALLGFVVMLQRRRQTVPAF
ncbi:TRAP transporter 4TM/12TM fusion protein [Breoghania corrubedonensis]|uniref:TRAP transporter 4TM/12TM fusion protein n=1 Tax=Breoghania corrubedonensis TaxID=665038 RepID=A0A2T5V5L1_9HYPH|nr:TRAP transporter permease [Breoghania corrubedonensis]PTW59042.1 TRAP transporter 4TM/12TM fusion protein [Breoghania corrubedonensis]